MLRFDAADDWIASRLAVDASTSRFADLRVKAGATVLARQKFFTTTLDRRRDHPRDHINGTRGDIIGGPSPFSKPIAMSWSAPDPCRQARLAVVSIPLYFASTYRSGW